MNNPLGPVLELGALAFRGGVRGFIQKGDNIFLLYKGVSGSCVEQGMEEYETENRETS